MSATPMRSLCKNALALLCLTVPPAALAQFDIGRALGAVIDFVVQSTANALPTAQ